VPLFGLRRKKIHCEVSGLETVDLIIAYEKFEKNLTIITKQIKIRIFGEKVQNAQMI